MVKLKSVSQPKSWTSSSWKWIAPYSQGAWRQQVSRPDQLDPVMARAGRLTRTPSRPCGPMSTTRVEEISREKSQWAARPAGFSASGTKAQAWTISSGASARRKIIGASILPLKQPSTAAPPRAAISSGQPVGAGAWPATAAEAAAGGSGGSSSWTPAWPTASVPAAGSKRAQTRCQQRARRATSVPILRLRPGPRPISAVALPSSPTSSAKPAPRSGSKRETMPWALLSGLVGQIVAITVKASRSSSAAASSTRIEEPRSGHCTREG